jgi:hypothetical protein
MPGERSDLGADGRRFSEDYLMKIGLPLFGGGAPDQPGGGTDGGIVT